MDVCLSQVRFDDARLACENEHRHAIAEDSGHRLYTVNRPGALAQLGERRLCKPEVAGSIPARSTFESPAQAGFSFPGL